MASEHEHRDALIAQVISGQITREEAEAQAARLGLRAIEYRPDPLDFDPMKERFWTPAMAAAWIAYRTPNAVRENWDVYRLKCAHWIYSDARKSAACSGFDLFSFGPATLRRLHLAEILDRPNVTDARYAMPVGNAVDALWQALRESCFEASGIDVESGKRELIDALRLQDLVFGEVEHRDVLRVQVPIGIGPLRYRDITVPMGAVRGLWGIRPPDQERIKLPTLLSPISSGYIPLFSAALWIATEGGAIDFDPRDLNRWKPAYAALLAHISSDEVTVSGLQSGQRGTIPGIQFAGIAVAYPYQDTPIELIFSETLYVDSTPYVGEEEWRDRWNDVLLNRSQKQYTHLMVKSSDIVALWQFDQQSDQRTGAPGRPTSRQLVELEFERRRLKGEALNTIGAEAEALSRWLRVQHKNQPQMKEVTVANTIRRAFNSGRNARK